MTIDLSPESLILFLVIEAALLGFLTVITRAYPLARLFILVGLSFWLFNLGSTVRLLAGTYQLAWVALCVEILSLAALSLSLMLAISRVFATGWWASWGFVRWIAGFYLMVFGIISLDLIGHLNFFVKGISRTDPGGIFQPQLAGREGHAIFVLAWLPSLVLLVTALLRRQAARFLAALLLAPVILMMVSGLFASPLPRSGTQEINLQFIFGLPFLLAVLYVARAGRDWLTEGVRLDLALDNMSEAVVVAGADGAVNYTNARAKTLGVETGQLLPEALLTTGVSEAEIDRKIGDFGAVPMIFTTPDQQGEIKLSALVDPAGQRLGSLLLSRDTSELERRNALLEQERARLDEANKRLNYLATHDNLTGLPNRDALVERLELELARLRGQGKFPGWETFRTPYTPENNKGVLLFLDLDNFKLVNDTLGHGMGDQVLVELSELIQEQLRPSDMLARFGGDEFAILLSAVNLDQAQQIAWRLCHCVESFRFKIEGQNFELGISIGLVLIDGQANAQTVLTQADIAMYSAKAQGRNRVVVYTQQDSSITELSDANQWAARIKDALQENRLVLHYQPVVRLSDRKVAHYEALIRLNDGQGNLIMPTLFISAAERFGLMSLVNRWIIQEVLAMLRRYPKAILYFNLSSRSLVDENLLLFMEEQIIRANLEPGRLGIEITENLPIDDIQQAEKCILRLKKLGCRFALDDFGAGFNSFALLGSLSVDKIKIDGLFIRSLETDPHNQAIVRTIHNLALALGKETVAEFVQNEVTAQILENIGITYGQGYELGRPAPYLLEQSMIQVPVLQPFSLRKIS